MRSLRVSAALCLTTVLAGCSHLPLSQKFSQMWEGDAAAVVPERLTAMWTDTVLSQPGKLGVRGFGGRLMFYGRGREKPVKVDGTLMVYAYDDTGAGPMQTPPTRKFVFPAEQLNDHYSESMLGHSYSFWLPWDKVGGEPRHISLIARFEPLKGPPIKSEITRHILPGIPSEPYDEAREATLTSRGQSASYFADTNQMPVKNYRRLFEGRSAVDLAGGSENGGEIQTASFEAPMDDSTAVTPAAAAITSEAPRDGMSTITIDIPRSFAQQTVLGGQPVANGDAPANAREYSIEQTSQVPSPARLTSASSVESSS
ncbi:MAG: hypothetical protein WD648_03640, partial [Planctomycetaceae bacterium]